tara:strand:+ start:42694 stop:43110 length:417 start_codon:yes stop_codon:yes gene_type:complete
MRVANLACGQNTPARASIFGISLARLRLSCFSGNKPSTDRFSCPLIFARDLIQSAGWAIIDGQLGRPVEVTAPDPHITQVSVTHQCQFTYMAHVLMALCTLLDESCNAAEQPAEGILDHNGNMGASVDHCIHCHLLWF